jgi:hypothetical protein
MTQTELDPARSAQTDNCLAGARIVNFVPLFVRHFAR